MDCIFCKIAVGEIPSYKVYEDDYVLAFLDIHPCSKGHAVVVPKKHVQSIFELDAEERVAVAEGLFRAAERVEKILRPDGMNIGINERLAAGQAVPHSHWHIIPRYAGDGGGSMHSIVKNSGNATVEDLAKLFAKQ